MIDDIQWVAMQISRGEGMSLAAIAKRLGVSASTVCRHLRMIPPSARVRAARPSTAAQKQRRRKAEKLCRATKKIFGWRGITGRAQPIVLHRRIFPSVALIAREMRAQGATISNSTLRRDLLARGLVAKKKSRGPRRRELDVKVRVKYCSQLLKDPAALRGFLFSNCSSCAFGGGQTIT